jgi:IS30 family transposase
VAPRLSDEEVARIRARIRKGASIREIKVEVGRSLGTIKVMVRQERQASSPGPVGWDPGPRHLSFDDRVLIKLGLERGDSYAETARGLGRATSTVSREVARCGGPEHYWPMEAHRLAWERARRPKDPKLVACSVLAEVVLGWLREFWSPEQISWWLRIEFEGDPMMWVSHETIYRSIYVQGKGELRAELARCLRTGRAQRRGRGEVERRGTIPGMTMISERPAEVADRAVPGHWEGDLIIGAGGRSAVATLVERQTRYALVLALPNGHGAEAVRLAITEAIKGLPAELVRSLTWDQGKEMAQHFAFSMDSGVAVYFCDPHSPWQRGTNENTNGLIRQWLPKGSDLSRHSAEDLARIAASLNNRPRKTLGWRKPVEKFYELVAKIA